MVPCRKFSPSPVEGEAMQCRWDADSLFGRSDVRAGGEGRPRFRILGRGGIPFPESRV